MKIFKHIHQGPIYVGSIYEKTGGGKSLCSVPVTVWLYVADILPGSSVRPVQRSAPAAGHSQSRGAQVSQLSSVILYSYAANPVRIRRLPDALMWEILDHCLKLKTISG